MERLNWKKIVLLCLPIVFAVSLAITLAAIMAQAGRSPDDSLFGEDGTTAQPSVPVILPTGSQGLSFSSRGDGTCELVGIGSCTDRDIVIPDESPDGDRVTAIAGSAFIGCKTIDSVKLPAGISVIGDYAFYASSIKSITLTPKIRTLGECAFANCVYLTAINVDSSNDSFCSIDGVLFNKDKSVLITYPSGKTSETYTIRRGVGKISNAAFLNCGSLKKIVFNGSPEEWSAIEIGANNTTLINVGITFAGESIK